MIHKTSIVLSLVAMMLCVASAKAQEFSIGGYGGKSNHVAALNDQSMVHTSSRNAGTVVGNLPKDYFRATPAQETEIEATSSNTTANMLVIAGFATMLCIGMTITGLCIMRRKPHSTPPARILLSA